jgi:hypothetical protein
MIAEDRDRSEVPKPDLRHPAALDEAALGRAEDDAQPTG